jgi:hypothetical protein
MIKNEGFVEIFITPFTVNMLVCANTIRGILQTMRRSNRENFETRHNPRI